MLGGASFSPRAGEIQHNFQGWLAGPTVNSLIVVSSGFDRDGHDAGDPVRRYPEFVIRIQHRPGRALVADRGEQLGLIAAG